MPSWFSLTDCCAEQAWQYCVHLVHQLGIEPVPGYWLVAFNIHSIKKLMALRPAGVLHSKGYYLQLTVLCVYQPHREIKSPVSWQLVTIGHGPCSHGLLFAHWHKIGMLFGITSAHHYSCLLLVEDPTGQQFILLLNQ